MWLAVRIRLLVPSGVAISFLPGTHHARVEYPTVFGVYGMTQTLWFVGGMCAL